MEAFSASRFRALQNIANTIPSPPRPHKKRPHHGQSRQKRLVIYRRDSLRAQNRNIVSRDIMASTKERPGMGMHFARKGVGGDWRYWPLHIRSGVCVYVCTWINSSSLGNLHRPAPLTDATYCVTFSLFLLVFDLLPSTYLSIHPKYKTLAERHHNPIFSGEFKALGSRLRARVYKIFCSCPSPLLATTPSIRTTNVGNCFDDTSEWEVALPEIFSLAISYFEGVMVDLLSFMGLLLLSFFLS